MTDREGQSNDFKCWESVSYQWISSPSSHARALESNDLLEPIRSPAARRWAPAEPVHSRYLHSNRSGVDLTLL